jgi:hypothetical protein
LFGSLTLIHSGLRSRCFAGSILMVAMSATTKGRDGAAQP